ncbi:flagellar biosynthetic protein FliR [Chelativorans sp. Marseille-P2723]|uniref:EscT/YscT/HrcT family type III secretion system export apparatus protein n=1 Tax=Chelativorans sp. Marseille-P2723 TaxID=2709133 RepID=UPI0015714F16|nr:flagellar biosynthetic protein FliR [Chelativorans sp. Marseille-P2723]
MAGAFSFLASDNRELLDLLLAFMLSVSRLTGFLAASPFFSRRSVPRVVRFGVMAALSFPIMPELAAEIAERKDVLPAYLLLIVKELTLGLFLGALTWLPVRGLELAGAILDTQRGSTQAEDFDVIFSAQTTPTAIFLSQLFAGYFFAAGGFLMVMTMFYQSVTIWRPLELLPDISPEMMLLFLRFAGMVYITAMVLVLPISGFMFLSDICIAFLARSAQSLNALTLGMPVKSAVLMVMLIFYMSILYPNVLQVLSGALELLKQALIP